jgi:uncharacterized membrane protein
MKTIIIILFLFSTTIFAADENQTELCHQMEGLASGYHGLAQATTDVALYEALVKGTVSEQSEVVRKAAMAVADLAWLTRDSLTKNMFVRLTYESCMKATP